MSHLCWGVFSGMKINMSNDQNCDKEYHEQRAQLNGLLVLVINEVLLFFQGQDKQRLRNRDKVQEKKEHNMMRENNKTRYRTKHNQAKIIIIIISIIRL